MTGLFRTVCRAALIGGIVFTTSCRAESVPQEAAREVASPAWKNQEEFWGLTNLHEVHLEVAADEWETMQKVIGGMQFPGSPPAAQRDPAEPEGAIERHRTAGFGMEFPWARGTMTAGGIVCANLGIRYKGNGSYMMSARGLKRNFKLEFDHNDEEGRFLGMKTLNLNAGSIDPTKIREALAYEVFRAAGTPAPRTAFARVTLTVPGQYDRELLGLYTLVEQVDRRFLESRFQAKEGLLLKPEWLRGIEYLGDDWEPYAARYQARREATPGELAQLVEFTKLVNEGTDAEFAAKIADYLEIDPFLQFLGVTTLLSSFDSFLFSPGHNYFLYLHPRSGKFHFLPWDQDLTFGGFPMVGTPEQRADLSLMHPHPGENALIDRLLALPEMQERYKAQIETMIADCFSAETLMKNFEAVDAITREEIAAETAAAKARNEGGGFGFGGPNPFGAAAPFPKFVEQRLASVAAQLAGEKSGYIPTTFGPPGGGNAMAKPLFQGLDADQNERVSKAEWLLAVGHFFDDSLPEEKSELTTAALTAGLTKRMPGPAPRGGFNPAAMLSGALMTRADKNKDQRLTREEFLEAAEKLFAEVDRGKKGELSSKQLELGFQVLMPGPFQQPTMPRPPKKRPPAKNSTS
ncbi:MAG: CotH kinase family protein [Planctomycetales bacterium]